MQSDRLPHSLVTANYYVCIITGCRYNRLTVKMADCTYFYILIISSIFFYVARNRF